MLMICDLFTCLNLEKSWKAVHSLVHMSPLNLLKLIHKLNAQQVVSIFCQFHVCHKFNMTNGVWRHLLLTYVYIYWLQQKGGLTRQLAWCLCVDLFPNPSITYTIHSCGGLLSLQSAM